MHVQYGQPDHYQRASPNPPSIRHSPAMIAQNTSRSTASRSLTTRSWLHSLNRSPRLPVISPQTPKALTSRRLPLQQLFRSKLLIQDFPRRTTKSLPSTAAKHHRAHLQMRVQHGIAQRDKVALIWRHHLCIAPCKSPQILPALSHLGTKDSVRHLDSVSGCHGRCWRGRSGVTQLDSAFC